MTSGDYTCDEAWQIQLAHRAARSTERHEWTDPIHKAFWVLALDDWDFQPGTKNAALDLAAEMLKTGASKDRIGYAISSLLLHQSLDRYESEREIAEAPYQG